MTARYHRRRVVIALLATLVACAAPTLPLPPPALPTVDNGTDEPDTTLKRYHLKSERGAEANALLVLLNRNPTVPGPKRAEATVADENGTWESDVYANPGDTIDITQQFGSTRSPPVALTLPR